VQSAHRNIENCYIMNVNAIADELAHEPEQELLIKRTPKKSGAYGQATNGAFGAPGAEPRWTHSTKEGIGTAYHTSCRLWFTISARHPQRNLLPARRSTQYARPPVPHHDREPRLGV
jgi:hypothetical protein